MEDSKRIRKCRGLGRRKRGQLRMSYSNYRELNHHEDIGKSCCRLREVTEKFREGGSEKTDDWLLREELWSCMRESGGGHV